MSLLAWFSYSPSDSPSRVSALPYHPPNCQLGNTSWQPCTKLSEDRAPTRIRIPVCCSLFAHQSRPPSAHDDRYRTPELHLDGILLPSLNILKGYFEFRTPTSRCSKRTLRHAKEKASASFETQFTVCLQYLQRLRGKLAPLQVRMINGERDTTP